MVNNFIEFFFVCLVTVLANAELIWSCDIVDETISFFVILEVYVWLGRMTRYPVLRRNKTSYGFVGKFRTYKLQILVLPLLYINPAIVFFRRPSRKLCCANLD